MIRWYRLVTVFTAVHETAMSSYTGVIVVHSQLCAAVLHCRVWGPTIGDVACVYIEKQAQVWLLVLSEAFWLHCISRYPNEGPPFFIGLLCCCGNT